MLAGVHELALSAAYYNGAGRAATTKLPLAWTDWSETEGMVLPAVIRDGRVAAGREVAFSVATCFLGTGCARVCGHALPLLAANVLPQ